MDDLTGINKIVKSALDSFFIKDYDTAINELKSAEVLDRENPEILYNIAVAYCRMNFYNQALDYFKKVLSLKMTYIDTTKVKKLIAFCYINMEKYNQALQFLNQLKNDELEDLQIISMKAYCHEKTGDPGMALSLHKKIIHKDRNNLNSINACAFIMAKESENLDKALRLAEIACSKDKGNGAFFDTLGYIMLKLGKLDKAEAYLKKAEQIIPFNQEIKEHLDELNMLKKKL